MAIWTGRGVFVGSGPRRLVPSPVSLERERVCVVVVVWVVVVR